MSKSGPRANWAAHVNARIEYVAAEAAATIRAIERMAETLASK